MNERISILLVEDDPLIAKTLKMSLIYKGFDLTVCGNIKEGLVQFAANTFALVLMDINLPDGSGLDACAKLRKLNPEIPIIMATAVTEEMSVVEGFKKGADDYIRKPYGIQELVARMNRLIEKKEKKSTLLSFESIRIDLKKRMAWAKDEPLSLGKREFDILTLLIKKAGEVVSRDDVLNLLGGESDVYDRTVDSHLSHLRKKLKNANVTELQITPVYGVGYRLEKASS